MLLRNRINSRAAFIVGAGPSLAENGRLLSEVGPKGFIICAAAALKPLLSLGVSPDIILVLESSDTSSYLTLNEVERQILKNEVVLAAASGSHPNHFKVDGFIKAIFHLNGGEAQLLGRGLFLPQGGNAGTAAFALAYVWGMSPLILVGQDQAYHGQLLHAPGTVDNVSEIDRATVVTIPAIGGGFAETNTSLLASINWYAEAANSIKRKSVQPKLINSTFRGAALKGFEEISLDEVLRNLGPEPNPISLKAMLSALPKPSAKEIRGDLRQMSALVSSLKSVLQVNFQRCINEMMNASKASAFLAHILAPALASGHRAGALKNLIWADGIILKMLASL
jgi:hypothetical protein